MKKTLLTFALLVPSLLSAEDYTVEKTNFQIDTELKAVFLPTETQAIFIQPEVWSDFTITSLVPQGAQVKKGDILIGIDTKKLDKYIEETQKSRETSALDLATLKHELAQLKINTPRNLKRADRLEREMKENLDWYTKIGKEKDIEGAKYSVRKSEQSLSYIKEEYKQLLKMYKEDDKVEETEEIILIRTRNGVATSELALKMAKINAEQTLNITIPRKLLSSQLAFQKAQLDNASAKEKLPRELTKKQLAVAKAIRDNEKAEKRLAKLKKDRALMNITAPADGLVYYGSIKQGTWNPAAAAKMLKVGAKLQPNSTWLTFIPASSTLTLSAFTGEANLPVLKSKDTQGYAVSKLNPYKNIDVKFKSISTYPRTNGSYQVILTPTLPKGSNIVPGMKAQAYMTSHKLENVTTIPKGYLTRGSDGQYTVKVKLADGKTETRNVSVSISNKDKAVITKGLEKGQVIIK